MYLDNIEVCVCVCVCVTFPAASGTCVALNYYIVGSETPSIATYLKKCCVYSMYVKTTMRMLTILREAEEWTHMHLREACLLFAMQLQKARFTYVKMIKRMHIK